MLNVKYLLTRKSINKPALSLLREKKEPGPSRFLYKNQDSLPRAYFVKSVQVIMDRQDIIEAVRKKRIDFKKIVILDEDINYQWKPSLTKEKIKIVKYKPNEIFIETFSVKSRLLFLSETFYPGWRAYVDEKEAKIYRANYMFRAVYLEPGKHNLKFVYNPFSFKLGAFISLFSIILLGFAASIKNK